MTSPLLRARVGPAPVWCSSRAHGNVGDHVGDDPVVVAANRARVASLAGLPDPRSWVWVRQVHGTAVFAATSAPNPGRADPPPTADAVVTARRGLPLAIVTADCAPIVLAADDAVAVVHAGHRGLLDGIVAAGVEAVRAISSGAVHAFLGPCIRPAHYEFGADDLARVVKRFGPSVAGETSTGRPALDIPAAVRVALEQAGVGDFVETEIDTAGSPEYFSYRRDGTTGRQVTIATLA